MRTALLVALAVVLTATSVPAGNFGSLQVTCWPGHRVYMDDVFQGITAADQDGLFLTAIPAGSHQITVKKLGKADWSTTVTVPPGGVVEVMVTTSEPQPDTQAPEPMAAAPAPESKMPAAVGKATAATVATVELEPANALTQEAEVAPHAPSEASTATAAAEEPVVITRDDPDAETVMFAYRIRGAALSAGGTVDIRRERGGPRSPVLAFWCRDDAQCSDQTSPTYPPGDYRFRVTCAHPTGRRTVSFSHDVYLNLDAASGESYLIDVTYSGDTAEGCQAIVRTVQVQ